MPFAPYQFEVMRDDHKLKCLTQYFQDISDGVKTFEVRFNDRNFQVGQIIELLEIVKMPKDNLLDKEKDIIYTGRKLKVRITYILDDINFCKEGYVVLGIEK